MKKMKLGLIVGLSSEPEKDFQKVMDLQIPTCQVSVAAERLGHVIDPQKLSQAAKNSGIEISSCFMVFEGQEYDRVRGPATMGMVAPKFQAHRLELAKTFSDYVKEMKINSITSHIGFIPDDPAEPLYQQFLEVMQELAEYCQKNDQIFCFETGQELPSTLLRTIRDVGTGNLFVNLDPANLILYGMANPLDALEIFGEYVRGFHAKDGIWPNRDEALGHETPLGAGNVRFDLLLPRLKEKGFTGPVTIEREISGPQQKIDILKAKELLEPYL